MELEYAVSACLKYISFPLISPLPPLRSISANVQVQPNPNDDPHSCVVALMFGHPSGTLPLLFRVSLLLIFLFFSSIYDPKRSQKPPRYHHKRRPKNRTRFRPGLEFAKFKNRIFRVACARGADGARGLVRCSRAIGFVFFTHETRACEIHSLNIYVVLYHWLYKKLY
jgi:hypothetical protein